MPTVNRAANCSRMRCALSAVLYAYLLCAPAALSAPDPGPVGVYFSTGDNDWLSQSPPVQSPASITAVFDAIKDLFGARRVYWRGLQSRMVVDHHVIRRENPVSAGFWEWERHLLRRVGTTAMARKATRERGMEFWGFAALFDHGADAEADSAKGFGPSPVEDELRVRHPEWVPVDRHGVRRQGGPIELAYPEARRALVERFTRLAADEGYDGIAFFTYVEHFTQRFDEEFGYSPPVVTEFRRRYGKDILTEEFDRGAWHRLRGEYVTLFLRELKARLAARGRKLAVCLDPQQMDYPAPWLIVRDMRPAGRIFLDWERWVREGIVDEIIIYWNGDKTAALRRALAAAQGTPCKVVAMWSPAPFPPGQEEFVRAGVMRVVSGDTHDLEAGRPGEHSSAALSGDDVYATLAALRQVVKGKLRAEAGALRPLLRHGNILVRRQAVAALAAIGGQEALAGIEGVLADPENCVRCVAAAALGKVNGPESVARLCEALRRHPTFQLAQDARDAFVAMGEDRLPEIARAAADKSPTVRRVAINGLVRRKIRPQILPILLRAMDDADWQVRWFAAYGLASYGPWPEAPERLLRALNDPDIAVQARATSSLESTLRTRANWLVGPVQRRALAALAGRFSTYGSRAKRPDADWGWRPVGNALLALGRPGRETLEGFLRRRDDRRLAELAWYILHVPQNGWTYWKASEQEAEEGFRSHPSVTSPQPAPSRAPAPEWLPYLVQGFDGLNSGEKGEAGDNLAETGLWRTFSPEPQGPTLQSELGRTGKAARLTRAQTATAPLEGLRTDYRLHEEETRVDLWIHRATPGTAFAIYWKDSGRSETPVGLFCDEASVLHVRDGEKWARTPIRMPAGSWQRVRMEILPREKRYRILVGEALETVVGEAPLDYAGTYNLLSVGMQPPAGGTLTVDDVSVTVRPGARSNVR